MPYVRAPTNHGVTVYGMIQRKHQNTLSSGLSFIILFSGSTFTYRFDRLARSWIVLQVFDGLKNTPNRCFREGV
jgi:hypothetical protein